MVRLLRHFLEWFWVWLGGEVSASQIEVDLAPDPSQLAYKVRPGDTLKSISRRFGTSVWILADLNDLDSAGAVDVGRRLRIPRPGTSRLAPSPSSTEPGVESMFETEPGPFIYIVKTGDTLDSIARRFGMSDTAIAEMSRTHIQNPVRPGHRLLIPGPEAQLKPERGAPPDLGPTADLPARKRGPSPVPLPQPGLEAPPVPDRDSGSEPELETPSGQHTYVAQAGDTLMTIARRFNVTVKAIIEASEIEDPNLLQPGQRLTIPGVYR